MSTTDQPTYNTPTYPVKLSLTKLRPPYKKLLHLPDYLDLCSFPNLPLPTYHWAPICSQQPQLLYPHRKLLFQAPVNVLLPISIHLPDRPATQPRTFPKHALDPK